MLYTAILSGNFTTDGTILDPQQIDGRWQRIGVTSQERKLGQRFYYPKFYDLCHGDRTLGIDGFERYEMAIDKDVELHFGEKESVVHLTKVALYLCPLHMAMFSIYITIDSEDYSEITYVMSRLRNLSSYIGDNQSLSPFVEYGIAPLVKFYKASHPASDEATFSVDNLLSCGNKLKLFQIVEMDEATYYDDKRDVILYEFGTMTNVKDHNLASHDAPSQRYFNEIVEQNLVSVFKNWTALALFDTFTMLGTGITESVRKNWIDNYFGMIYLYNIFVKSYLFDLNNNYDAQEKDKGARDLFNETYDLFDTHYYFPHISYNFLPRKIHIHISDALEIDTEKKRIFERINRQNDILEKQSDTKMNQLLFVMTCLTIFSAIWDACCLFNEMYPFSSYWDTSNTGFRVIGTTAFSLLLVCFCLIITSRRWRRK